MEKKLKVIASKDKHRQLIDSDLTYCELLDLGIRRGITFFAVYVEQQTEFYQDHQEVFVDFLDFYTTYKGLEIHKVFSSETIAEEYANYLTNYQEILL